VEMPIGYTGNTLPSIWFNVNAETSNIT
jgi:hypothetical protein